MQWDPDQEYPATLVASGRRDVSRHLSTVYGQSRRVANFIFAWWNAEVHGGFDLTDLADLDPHVCEDVITVFTWIAREKTLSYPDAYKPEIVEIIRRWRPHIDID